MDSIILFNYFLILFFYFLFFYTFINKFLVQLLMSSLTKEVEKEFLPLLRICKDGMVERLMGTPYVPPSPQDPETGVSSKDITISQDPSISARLYLPKLTKPTTKISPSWSTSIP